MFKIVKIFLCILLLSIIPSGLVQGKEIPKSKQAISLSFAPIVKAVSPAVVNIYTKRTVTQAVRSPFFNDPFFSQMFRSDIFGQRMRKQVESALGSGVIVDKKGLVITNAHVVKGASEITLILSDGYEFDAELALADEASDLAVLRFNPDNHDVPSVRLKPSESLEVGDLVLAIGNPFGVGQTVTSGIVSAQGRSSLNINDFNFFIQTDAAINPGNSGGPLVALDGGVVGINTAIFSQSGGSLGIGFAVPSEMVVSVLAAVKSGQSGKAGIIRPWLGVSVQNITSDIAQSLDLETPQGTLITDLHSESPLKAAGMKVGDVVHSFNGKPIRDAAEMKFRMATIPLGKKARFEVFRKGKYQTFHVKAMAPPDKPPRKETSLSGIHPLNGATIANMNPAVANELGVLGSETGVVILKVPKNSYGSRLANPGDIILKINNEDIKDVSDVVRVFKKQSPKGWVLVLNSQGRIRQVVIR